LVFNFLCGTKKVRAWEREMERVESLSNSHIHIYRERENEKKCEE
jgi:hypothetical protein